MLSRLAGCLAIGLALGPQGTPHPPDQDPARGEAKAAYAQGNTEAARGTAESRRAALDAFQRARVLWQSIGDRAEEATTLNRIGLVHMQLANLQEALEAHGEALRLRQAIGDRRGEGVSLSNIAAIHMRRGDYDQAQAFYEQALPARRDAGDRGGEGWTLVGLAVAQSVRAGGWQSALPHFQRAYDLFVDVKDRPGEAEALYYIGYAHKQLNAFDDAMTQFDRALALRRELRDLGGQASVLNQIVGIHLQLGDPTRALELIDDILTLRRQAGDRRGEGYTLQLAGMASITLGDHTAALAWLAEALQIFETIGDREGQTSALANMARVHAAAGDAARALDVATRAQQVLDGRRHLIAATLPSIKGDALAALGRRDEAQDAYAHALAESRRLGETLPAARALTGLGRLARERGDLLASRERLLDALASIESVRAAVAQPDQRASFLGLTQDAYESTIETLMALHRAQTHGRDGESRYAAEALAVSERRRARTLIEMLAQVRAETEIEPTPTRATQATLDLAGIQHLLDRDTLLIEYSLGQRRSYVWTITPDSLTVHDLPDRARIETAAREVHRLVTESTKRALRAPMQRAVAELGRLLLEPLAGELATKRLVIVADGALQYVPFAALPEPRDGGARPNRGENGARPVSTAFDAAPLIVRHEIVMLPSASTLALLRQPSTRPPRDRSVAARKAVAVFADPVLHADDPRISATDSPRAAGAGTSMPRQRAWPTAAAAPPATTAASRAPVVDAGGRMPARDLVRAAEGLGIARFERLPYTRDEAMAIAIAAKAGAGTSLTALGFEATRELALSPALDGYRIVHFATHTALDARHPERSGIVLTLVDRDRRAVDGFLRLHDIFTLRLSTDVVVLSACQTALGKDVRGEGLIGLTRGFMHAGASQVVASLWNIRDRATAQLMARFYAGLLERGLTPAAALREAQVSMWKRPEWRMPAYWAGFVVQGDWRDAEPAAGQTTPRFRGPKAALTPTVVTPSPIRPGGSVRVALKVRLPARIHVQSDKPRDPAFIPTALTIEPPSGVRLEKIVYPAASDLEQEGLDEPLAVFEREFTITAHLTLGNDVRAGDVVVPARLRYQACDEQVCYPPATVDTRWTLRVTRAR